MTSWAGDEICLGSGIVRRRRHRNPDLTQHQSCLSWLANAEGVELLRYLVRGLCVQYHIEMECQILGRANRSHVPLGVCLSSERYNACHLCVDQSRYFQAGTQSSEIQLCVKLRPRRTSSCFRRELMYDVLQNKIQAAHIRLTCSIPTSDLASMGTCQRKRRWSQGRQCLQNCRQEWWKLVAENSSSRKECYRMTRPTSAGNTGDKWQALCEKRKLEWMLK